MGHVLLLGRMVSSWWGLETPVPWCHSGKTYTCIYVAYNLHTYLCPLSWALPFSFSPRAVPSFSHLDHGHHFLKSWLMYWGVGSNLVTGQQPLSNLPGAVPTVRDTNNELHRLFQPHFGAPNFFVVGLSYAFGRLNILLWVMPVASSPAETNDTVVRHC